MISRAKLAIKETFAHELHNDTGVNLIKIVIYCFCTKKYNWRVIMQAGSELLSTVATNPAVQIHLRKISYILDIFPEKTFEGIKKNLKKRNRNKQKENHCSNKASQNKFLFLDDINSWCNYLFAVLLGFVGTPHPGGPKQLSGLVRFVRSGGAWPGGQAGKCTWPGIERGCRGSSEPPKGVQRQGSAGSPAAGGVTKMLPLLRCIADEQNWFF